MKHLYSNCFIYLLCLIFILGHATTVYSQCDNADFESGTFANWQGRTGSCCPINTPTNGIVAGRHTIMTGPGTDGNTCNNVTVVAPGSTFSARLGNPVPGSQGERLLYTFNVTAQSNLIIYKYAVVLEDFGHIPSEQPRFEAQVRDANNNVIPCTYYQVAAGAGIPGFQTCGIVRYKDWTTVGVDVSAYIGQTVTLDFATGDCVPGAHFGYAYVDASCSPLQIDSRYCIGNNQAQLTAPIGFTYLWSTGETTPTITITNPAQGQQVSCTITSVTGCQAVLTSVLSPSNSLSFFALANNCSGGTTFNNSSTAVNGTIVGYEWDFGDATPIDTAASPVHVYASPGTYNVTLVAISDIGCKDTINQPVVILPTPIAAFNTNNACLGQTVTLTDQSTMQQGTINQWAWNLGDNSPLLSFQNGTYVYADTGLYTVSLIVSENGNCPDTLTKTVNIKPNPVSLYTATDVCNGLANTFTNQTLTTPWGTVVYSWDFGDNVGTSALQNPSYTYTNPGAYPTTLIVTQSDVNNSCADTFNLTANVFSLPLASFTSNQYVCLGTQTNFVNQSSIATNEQLLYNWNFGNGNTANSASPSYTYPNFGTYTTTLIATTLNNCADTVTAPQNIYAIPVAGVTPDVAAGCENLVVNYIGQSTVALGNITGWNWDLGNSTTATIQNPTVTYPNGNYNVTVVVAAGDINNTCYDTAQFTINSYAVPQAAFTSNQYVCLGTPTDFVNQSAISTNEQLLYNWDYGNGNTANSASPSYTYPNFGTYTTTLIATTLNNCADTVTAPQNIYAIPVAGVTPDVAAGCENLVVNYIGQSTVALGNITGWNWNLGNSTTATIQNPTVTYPNGNYNVTVVVAAGDINNTCYDTAQFTINSYAVPQAAFTSDQYVCLGTKTDFINLSTVSTNEQLLYNWDFGNGNTDNSAAPSYTYPNFGTYTTTLIVTTLNNCADTAQLPQNIYAIPLATIVPDVFNGCQPLTINYTGQGTVGLGNITGYDWNLGNASTSALQNPTTVYPNEGSYTATLIVAAGDINNTCYDTTQQVIDVYPLPVANFVVADVCDGVNAVFTNQSSVSMGAIATSSWDFGDNAGTSGLFSPSYLYPNSGLYNAQLIVTTDNNCIDTVSNPIEVFPLPVAVLASNINAACTPALIDFSDLSTISSGTIVQWNWDFGDGTTSTLQYPKHSYVTPGTYTVTLEVTTNNGCTDVFTFTDMITAYPNPVADFVVEPTVTDELNINVADLTNQSQGANTYSWDFGNGYISAEETPRISYGASGTYTITLYVENQWGCADQTSREITINPVYTFYIPNAFSPNGDNVNDFFFGTGTNIISYEMRIFNRWGEAIFLSQDMEYKWDGTLRGQKVQDEVYIYAFTIFDIFGTKHIHRGSVTLIK